MRAMIRVRAIPVAFVLAAVVLFAPRANAQPAPDPAKKWPESPAKEADPPLLPNPTDDRPPMSSQGTDLTPALPPAQPTIVIGDNEGAARAEAHIRELEARLSADEARLQKDEQRLRVLRYLKIGAYIQPQLLIQSFDANASPNLQANGRLPDGIASNDVIAKADGTTTNGTMFRLRRTRLRTSFTTDVARLYLELDPFPLGGVGPGIGTVVRDAEVTGIAHWSRDIRTDFGAGVFMVGVANELRERSDVRPFIERSWAIQNIFPAERDIGVHARTFAVDDQLQLDLGVVNGQKLGQPQFVAQPDLNKSKDVFAQLRYRMSFLTFGVSGYLGRGEIVDPTALRFKQFSRWWVDYEISAHKRFTRSLGESRVVAELAIAQNMDTGLHYGFAVPKIPAALHDDVSNQDERMLVLRAEQELTRWALLGYRYDFYTPDSSIKNNARDTHAFVIVARLGPNLRFMNELDYAIDNVHPTGSDAAAKHILAFSSVLQGSF
jgi:hypothetical protein